MTFDDTFIPYVNQTELLKVVLGNFLLIKQLFV